MVLEKKDRVKRISLGTKKDDYILISMCIHDVFVIQIRSSVLLRPPYGQCDVLLFFFPKKFHASVKVLSPDFR